MSVSSVLVELPTHTKPSYIQHIKGKRSPLSADLDEFRGIPFGEIPGRWQHSHIRDKLPEDEFRAWINGPKCPQLPDFNKSEIFFQSHLDFPIDVEESEFDCLNLFIIRPSLDALHKIEWDEGRKLPVFVWIHGGGFGFGSSTDPMWGMNTICHVAKSTIPDCFSHSSEPSRLVLQSIALGTPIIAVNIGYRLGIFGFLASSEILRSQSMYGMRGCNFGLRDQKVGIAWVSRNIHAFGGDPAKITIGGQSAGGCSTHAQIMDAMNDNENTYFRRACIQSGAIGTLGPVTVAEADKHWESLCRNLQIADDHVPSRLNALKFLAPEILLQATRELHWYTFDLVDDGLTLVVRREMDGCKPSFAINLGKVDDTPGRSTSGKIDIMIGDTGLEGSIYRRHAEKFSDISEIRSLFLDSLNDTDKVNRLLECYGLNTDASAPKLIFGILSFLSDSTCSFHVAQARNFFLKKNTKGLHRQASTVQNYRIKFGNPFPGPDFGVSQHCVELIYLFDAFQDNMTLIDADINKEENLRPRLSNKALVKEVQRRWISFIVEDDMSEWSETDITVFEKDGTVSIQSLQDDREWIEQQERFTLLAAEQKGVTIISEHLIDGLM